MKILLTGANGYIGRRLLPRLKDAGHEVVCLVRDRRRFTPAGAPRDHVEVIEADLLDAGSLDAIPGDVDAAYYLVHSMGSVREDFPVLEARAAENFAEALARTRARQVVYLSGIIDESADRLSPHLASRLEVERILGRGPVPVTVLRAAIVVGSGSASFEIIRDLVEKLPVMIAPKWLRTRCQPIAVRNVLDYLAGVLGLEAATGRTFDIGGPDVFTYQELLLRYAAVRGLRRLVIPVPLLTPRLSSYWLYFVTTTSFPLARALVDSLRHEVVCSENRIRELVDVDLIPFDEAVRRAFALIEQNQVPSSWIDSLSSGRMDAHLLDRVEVPSHGVLRDERCVTFARDPDEVRENVWRIGGRRGWYSMDWAWRLRGWLDRLVGGIGLRRGRRDPRELRPGDALDFWRVLVADEAGRRLTLFAEMKLPGEAWLEFRIEPAGDDDGDDAGSRWRLRQTATFRPRGIGGRLYWYAVMPLHHLVFGRMAREIVARPASA